MLDSCRFTVFHGAVALGAADTRGATMTTMSRVRAGRDRGIEYTSQHNHDSFAHGNVTNPAHTRIRIVTPLLRRSFAPVTDLHARRS